jgi:hypothetical protein
MALAALKVVDWSREEEDTLTEWLVAWCDATRKHTRLANMWALELGHRLDFNIVFDAYHFISVMSVRSVTLGQKPNCLSCYKTSDRYSDRDNRFRSNRVHCRFFGSVFRSSVNMPTSSTMYSLVTLAMLLGRSIIISKINKID